MHKKVIIIIAIVVGLLIIGSGVVGVILALNRTQQAATNSPAATINQDPSKQEAQTKPDLSVDLGACTAVDHDMLVGALKPPVAEVRDAINRGFGYEGNGDQSQSCVYPFVTDDNTSNRFTLTVTKFKDDTNKTNSLAQYDEYTAVTAIGEKAGFISATDAQVLKQDSYSLIFVKDMNQYSLVILQPSSSDLFTKETAQSALEAIAKTI